jgi:hypothetical protein
MVTQRPLGLARRSGVALAKVSGKKRAKKVLFLLPEFFDRSGLNVVWQEYRAYTKSYDLHLGVWPGRVKESKGVSNGDGAETKVANE